MSLTTQPAIDQVDVRGPRFAAWLTTAVLLAVLAMSAVNVPAAAALLAAQAVVFAIGAALGPRRHPYGRLFATLVAPRLGPPTDREPVAPLRFAQFVGVIFATTGVAGFALGAVTAALGEKAAMACTVAVEETIDEHYAQQVRDLGETEPALRGTLERFRAEELEHRDIGLAHGAEQTPGYRLLSAAIKTGCRVAIKLSERI